MPIDLTAVAITLILGLAIGALVGWLASRPAHARLQHALEKDRAVHAERLKAYGDAETKLRDAFQALSADALKTNNEAFLVARRNAAARSAHRGDRRHRCAQEGDRGSAGADGEDARAGRPRDQGLRAPPHRNRRAAHAADRLARHRRPGPARRDAAADRRPQAPRRPRPLGRAPAEARRRALRDDRALRFHRAAHDSGGDDEGRIRPDVIVRLPGGKQIVIDAKAPLDAYLRALEAPDEESRQKLLARPRAAGARPHLAALGQELLRQGRVDARSSW